MGDAMISQSSGEGESSSQCPSCGGELVPDSDYPDDLLCGKCLKVFDSKTLKFLESFDNPDNPLPAHKYRVMCVTWYEEDANTGDEAKRIIEMNLPGEFQYMRAERLS